MKMTGLNSHHDPKTFSDKFAFLFVKFLRFFADTFFAKRYGNRAVVLETIAAIPGMVAATLIHLKCLRKMCAEDEWIKTLLDEAENERMHLMTFIEIARPSMFERFIVIVVQGIFYNCFFALYLISPKTAHRIVGYFEEEAVISYTFYLQQVENCPALNVDAPDIAKNYWNLPSDAKLRDVIIAVRADEMKHRDVNHGFADDLNHEQNLD